MASPSEPGLPDGLNGDLFTIAGPFLYGGMASALFLGALIVQTIVYFSRASGDRMLYKLAVAALLCSSLSVVGAVLFLQNSAFIANFGNVATLHAWPVAVFVPLAAPVFSACTSQALFGYRIFALSGRSAWVGAGLGLLLAINAVSGLVAMIIEAQGGGPVPLNENDLLLFIPIAGEEAKTSFWRTIVVNEIFLFTSAATDVLLTICLTVLLLTRRKKSTELSRDTNSLIWRVVTLSVTTGAMTAFYSIGVALLVLVSIHDNNIAMAFVLPLVHVYGNVCLASLNLRRSMNRGHNGSSSASRSIGAMPSVDKMKLKIEMPGGETPYGVPPYSFPPQRSFSTISPSDSRPETAKSELTRNFSNRIKVSSSIEQHVEMPSPEADSKTMPMLSYFSPRPARSQYPPNARSPPYFNPEAERTAQVHVHAPFPPSSRSPADAHPFGHGASYA